MKKTGKPRTNAERKKRHASIYGKTSPLPARGTGRKKK